MSKTFKKEVIKINPENKKQEALILYKKWMDVTTKDSCFVIDKIKDNIDEISNIIDKSKICVMGHSFGGSTALALGRIRKDIYAVVALESPFMYDVKSIENDKFVFEEEEYPTRMLNVYSDSSYSNLRIWNQYSQNYKYLNLNNGKYKSAYLKGLGHMHLCDFQLVSPLFSWILSGVDSPNLAKDNLKMLNKTILEYFNEISF